MARTLILMLAGSLSLLAGQVNGQSQDDDGTNGTKIIFHVTSVRQEDAPDDCPAAGCEATRFTIEGYADVRHDSHPTEYVLRCSEVFFGKPTPHYADICGRVHAHNDYEATVFADSVYFADWKGKKKPEGAPPEALYRIMSGVLFTLSFPALIGLDHAKAALRMKIGSSALSLDGSRRDAIRQLCKGRSAK